jgi:hypothetical protein
LCSKEAAKKQRQEDGKKDGDEERDNIAEAKAILQRLEQQRMEKQQMEREQQGQRKPAAGGKKADKRSQFGTFAGFEESMEDLNSFGSSSSSSSEGDESQDASTKQAEEDDKGGEKKTDKGTDMKVADILEGCGLSQYAKAFADEEITDLRTLADLGDDDLKELGLKMGERKTLLRHVKQVMSDASFSTGKNAAASTNVRPEQTERKEPSSRPDGSKPSNHMTLEAQQDMADDDATSASNIQKSKLSSKEAQATKSLSDRNKGDGAEKEKDTDDDIISKLQGQTKGKGSQGGPANPTLQPQGKTKHRGANFDISSDLSGAVDNDLDDDLLSKLQSKSKSQGMGDALPPQHKAASQPAAAGKSGKKGADSKPKAEPAHEQKNQAKNKNKEAATDGAGKKKGAQQPQQQQQQQKEQQKGKAEAQDSKSAGQRKGAGGGASTAVGAAQEAGGGSAANQQEAKQKKQKNAGQGIESGDEAAQQSSAKQNGKGNKNENNAKQKGNGNKNDGNNNDESKQQAQKPEGNKKSKQNQKGAEGQRAADQLLASLDKLSLNDNKDAYSDVESDGALIDKLASGNKDAGGRGMDGGWEPDGTDTLADNHAGQEEDKDPKRKLTARERKLEKEKERLKLMAGVNVTRDKLEAFSLSQAGKEQSGGTDTFSNDIVVEGFSISVGGKVCMYACMCVCTFILLSFIIIYVCMCMCARTNAHVR